MTDCFTYSMADSTACRKKKFPIIPYACLYIDASWSDVLAAISFSLEPEQQRSLIEYKLDRLWNHTHATPSPILPCLSVRTAFDLLLSVKNYPPGSEMVFCAVNIPDMARIVRHHGIRVVALDLDMDTMMPKVEDLKALITPRTVAVLVAHLYGRQNNLDEIISVARSHHLDVLEDCAEAFCGLQEHGHPRADVTFFSFGLIKASTAFGGAIAVVRNPSLLHQMRTLQRTYPIHGRSVYLRKVLKYSMIMTALNSPFIVKNGTLLLNALGIDHRNLFVNSIRGFPTRFFENIRMRPSITLLYMLYRRLKNFDAESFKMGNIKGDFVSQRLPHGFTGVGLNARNRNYWLFPVVVEDPQRVLQELNARGVDAYRGATQLDLIESDVPFPGEMANPSGRTAPRCKDMKESGRDNSSAGSGRRSFASTSDTQANSTDSLKTVNEAVMESRASSGNHKEGTGQATSSAGSEGRSFDLMSSIQVNPTDSFRTLDEAPRADKASSCDHSQGTGQVDSESMSFALASDIQPKHTASSENVNDAVRPGNASCPTENLQGGSQSTVSSSWTEIKSRAYTPTESFTQSPTTSSGSTEHGTTTYKFTSTFKEGHQRASRDTNFTGSKGSCSLSAEFGSATNVTTNVSSCELRPETTEKKSMNNKTSEDTVYMNGLPMADNPSCAFDSSRTSQADSITAERILVNPASSSDSWYSSGSEFMPMFAPLSVQSGKSQNYSSGYSPSPKLPNPPGSNQANSSNRNVVREPMLLPPPTTDSAFMGSSQAERSQSNPGQVELSQSKPAHPGDSPHDATGDSPHITSGKYPHEARHLIDHVVYLPVHKRVPFHYLEQICAALEDVASVLAKEKKVKVPSRL